MNEFKNFKLDKTGIQSIPFCQYSNGGKATFHTVNVVWFVNCVPARLTVIIVEDNGEYQDFYLNETQGFKMLSEEGEYTPESWWEEEEVGVKCPDFFTKVNNNIAKKLNY